MNFADRRFLGLIFLCSMLIAFVMCELRGGDALGCFEVFTAAIRHRTS